MDYDLIIIGSGPGGYVAAIRAGQTGLKTAVIERNKIGGMCLNWGCIPTKSLLESAKRLRFVKDAAGFGVDGIDKGSISFNWPTAVKRAGRIVKRLTKGIEFLMKKNGVEVITGTAAINGDKSISVDNRRLTAKNIILATGSRPVAAVGNLPAEVLVEVEQLLAMETLPESVAVVGGGAHAVELAQFFNMVGLKVTLVVEGDVLVSNADPFLSGHALKMLKKAKVNVVFSAGITGYENGELVLKGGDVERVACGKVVNAADRKAVVPEHEVALEIKDGFVTVDEHMRTSVEGIYAVGDMNGRSIFAHAASVQGLHAVNVINGIDEEGYSGERFPVNIYTYPEMAQVGFTEEQVREMGNEYKVNEFPLNANGKALTQGESDGMVRLLSDKKYGEVLGVQVVAPHATDMIAEAALLMRMEGTVYEVAQTVHAHPTVSEIFMEAGFDAFEQPIHK